MAIRKYRFDVASDGDQVGTGYSPRLSGLIKSVQYIKDNYTDGVDFTITAEATGAPIWVDTNINASETVNPRAATCGITGVAALYAGSGTAVNDRIALGNDRVKVVLASAGANKNGTFVVTVEDPRGRYAL